MPKDHALMPDTITLANARLILPQGEMLGRISFRGSEIIEVAAGGAVPAGAEDCGGQILAPGLVELHTDNLERHIRPRPAAHWPHKAAILAHDAEMAACGITTVYDAIRLGAFRGPGSIGSPKKSRALASELLEVRAQGLLKISHHIHLRAEVCSHTLAEEMAEFGPEDRVGIVSVMDHTPGQRQFADLGQYATYMQGKYAMSDAEFAAHVEMRTELGARVRDTHEAVAVEAAQRLGAALASHDDTTVEHVARSAGYGIGLAEFPTTEEAARACHQFGLKVMMGAPNLIRGGSHSGNVAAAELAEVGLLDILSSDYVPSALLYAAVMLGERWGDLPRAMSTVTSAPAQAAGLLDRGQLAEGMRADLVRFSSDETVPVLSGVWSAGRRVA